ncbi:LYR motif-containing protein 4 [Eleginops maclovinus]|uniref:LYR motif-containing protein 4 n=1 Tax=Eleginops maclovinus TaxID=56733 RepID=UPI00307FF895
MAVGRSRVISLYRSMIAESYKFPSYNYRKYAVQRVRDAFRANSTETDPQMVERLVTEGQKTLAVIQRQVSIGRMFEAQKSVLEN